ncbi:hypothetical protein E2C01_033857 [Portunus trituberculatus]|uniref:Uncharacterized protein n=1 Tax=Portunus trituberculatus TaxID=210409 RepID=A0A5B7EZZ0_PORTR|nr:hypothetical protein [Portunus trituberculatus]
MSLNATTSHKLVSYPKVILTHSIPDTCLECCSTNSKGINPCCTGTHLYYEF